MILIGFSGPAGSGKDTAADALSRYLDFSTLAFADTLKDGICRMFYLPHDIFYERETKEKKIPGMNHSPRDLAKIIGTECVRNMIGENTWIHVMAKRYLDVLQTSINRVAITDVRFENEAEWVRRAGGTLVHVTRSGVNWDATAHASEHGIAIDDCDCVLTNTGTLEEFEQKTLSLTDLIIKHGGNLPAHHPFIAREKF